MDQDKSQKPDNISNVKKQKKRTFTVLSIEGGGVRGVIPVRILVEIEKLTGKPIAETFDIISGVSTGGIIAASLSVPDINNPKKPCFSARDILSFYYSSSPKIFPEVKFKNIKKFINGTAYDAEPLEKELKKEFGDAKMKDAITSLMIPTTDIKNFRPVWISHIKGQKDASKENWSSMLMRDAVRATTSAPTFFPAKYVETTPNELTPNIKHRHALIDGSFFSGNTMRHLIAEAKKLAPADAEIVVVHIGTGETEHKLSPKEYNALGPIGLLNGGPNGSVLLSLISSMSTIDALHDLEDEFGDRIFYFNKSFCNKIKGDLPSRALDDSSKENLTALEKLAEEIIDENKESLKNLCCILKNREIAEKRHLDSNAAFEKLVKKITDTPDIKSLLSLRRKILRYNIDASIPEPKDEDIEIKKLVKGLTNYHKVEINSFYYSLLDERQKEQERKLLQDIKNAANDITEPKISKDNIAEKPKRKKSWWRRGPK